MGKSKFDPRKLMEYAIQVMRESIPEPRHDGKVSPMVGAVLFKPDGTTEGACRGELRYGDHAEYTLLERKNRDQKLDGTILFATLEPCAPGSRRHPKLGCAERIVLARVSEVWIGIEDPDPSVDRKGIRFLQENGVIVHMFDRDLQDIIYAENRRFIEQAQQRAEAAQEKKPASITLSSFELIASATLIDDFDPIALQLFWSKSSVGDSSASPEFLRYLILRNLLTEESGRFVPTGFGLLLFGRSPRDKFPQAGLFATIEYPDGTEEVKNFDGPMVLIPNQLEKWLRDKLPNVIDRSKMHRIEISALPFEMIREAVVNALVHRDYDIAGARCQILVTTETIVVKSPGGPLSPITLEQLQTFNAPTLSRNPILHFVFASLKLAEERALGMKTFRSMSARFGLPLPRYVFDAPYLNLTLYRHSDSVTQDLEPTVLAALNEDERTAWQFVATKDSVTTSEVRDSTGYDERKVQRVLKKLIELGLVRRVGRGPATRYEKIATRYH